MTAKENYIAYCAKHPVPLFFKPYWLAIFTTQWEVIEAKKHKHIVYFVYSMEVKLQFKIIRNNFLTPYSGFLFSNPELSTTEKQSLVNTVLSQIPPFHECEIDLHPAIGCSLNFHEFTVIPKLTNILDITSMPNTIQNYKPALKRQIKKAAKNIRIEERDDIHLFYALHEMTFLKQQKKAMTPLHAFEKVWTCCKTNEVGKLLFAIDDANQVHAALLMAFDDTCAYYLAGGTDATFYGSGAMSYLMHTAIEKAAAMGKKKFDFEGSMIPGVNRFFRNFNPFETHYVTLAKIDSILMKWYKKWKQ